MKTAEKESQCYTQKTAYHEMSKKYLYFDRNHFKKVYQHLSYGYDSKLCTLMCMKGTILLFHHSLILLISTDIWLAKKLKLGITNDRYKMTPEYGR